MATTEEPRNVWVQQLSRHVPAHRIPPEHVPPAGKSPDAYVIACPPLMAFGGTAITRSEARDLQVHPCMKCFAITPRDYPPPPPPDGAR